LEAPDRACETIAEVIEEAVVDAAVDGESSEEVLHPTSDTTAEEMARARPDLLTGELRAPKEE
jgi:hypothetical protein